MSDDKSYTKRDTLIYRNFKQQELNKSRVQQHLRARNRLTLDFWFLLIKNENLDIRGCKLQIQKS